MLCPAEKSFDSGKLACDNKAKEVFPERMKQAGDTMKYIASPNLVLEALVYLGARANSYDQAYLESRLTSKGYQDLSRFRQRYAPFAALRQQLDAQVHVPEALLKGLFVDLVSIAQNTGGAYSIALLLFAPAACQCSGVLQDFLRNLLQTDGTSKNHIFRCLHLLGDQTRFDIFCYLLEHPAYGQELSDHFGLARNTIHHHMNKLFDAGLVTYMVKGTRVYYSIDKDHFSNLLDQQRQLLLHGYRTPGK